MKTKLIIATLLAFGLGITTANAANSPQLVFEEKQLTKSGLYKYCDNGNLVYLYFVHIYDVGYGRNSMSVIPNGCKK